MPAPRPRTGWRRSGPWYPLLVCGLVGGVAAPAALAAPSGAPDTQPRKGTAAQATDTSGARSAEERAPRGGVLRWASVDKKYPNRTTPAGVTVRVGHEDETGGTWRTFITMNTRDLWDKKFTKATFRIRNTYSWSCAKRPVQLWDTGQAYASTTWNKQPKWYKLLGTVTDAKGHGRHCPVGELYFDVTQSALQAKKNKWPTMTLGLRAANENDTFAWKKFDASTSTLITR
ncbi:hypothetical protein [Streptomyces sp. NPDC052496]|uniref:hypothetical protein n=1 Tax=Streptomyces sp. NPDC052496 TaxID=3154951 RepID=UPI00342E6770